jgi:hypothetical protein
MANARPLPSGPPASASMVARAGLRTALPKRSATTSATACHSAWTAARIGTATTVITSR